MTTVPYSQFDAVFGPSVPVRRLRPDAVLSPQPLHLQYVLDGFVFRDDVRPCPEDRLRDAKRVLP